MSKQYNKAEKRKRRQKYLKRRANAAKAKRPAIAPEASAALTA
jgi:hypothetical protein